MRALHPVRLLTLLVVFLITPGCTTPTRSAEEQLRTTERQAAEARRAAVERQRAEEGLRRKFLRYSTGELKLMDARYRGLEHASGREVNVRVNSLISPKADERNMQRVLEIERELLRRWKLGDAEAYLPDFGTNSPTKK
jgi:hypothetical protein